MAATIAIIDDDPTVIDYYRRILVGVGYRVVTARDGEAGLRLATEEHPDLIVLDMMMPDCDGLEFLRRFAQALPEATRPPIIADTGFSLFEQEAKRYGVAVFMNKPIASEDLVDTIEMVLLGRSIGGIAERHRRRHDSVLQQARRERDELLERVDLDQPELQSTFNRLAGWLTRYFDVQMALLNVEKRDKLRVATAFGKNNESFAPGTQLDPELTFCDSVIVGGSSLILGDATEHVLFRGRPAAHLGYRFYAGVPLRTSHGVIVGTLCLIDRLAKSFHSEDMAILEHLALRVGRRLETAAGLPNDGLDVYDQPGVFSHLTLELLLDAELRRVGRQPGQLELALIDVTADDEEVARCGERMDQTIDCRRFSLSRFRPGTLALLRGADEANHVHSCMDYALSVLSSCLPVRAVGLGSYSGGAPTTLSAFELTAATEVARARALARGGGVERIALAAPAPTADAQPDG